METIDNAVREALIEALGWEESYAEPYIVPVRKAVMKALANGGYKVVKGT